MNNKELTELKREFDKTFQYLFSSCDGREGYDAEVTQDVWSFFLPHLKSSDEIKREILKEFVEQVKVALKETEIKGKDATEDFAMDMVLTQMMPDMLDAWLDFYLKENNE